MSSISSCGDYEHSYCIDPNFGIAQIDDVNISNNVASGRSGFDIDNGENNSFLMFTSLVNNSDKDTESILNFYGGANLSIIKCNFLKNYGKTIQIGQLLNLNSNTEIENCCFKENDCSYVFSISSGHSTIVLNCYYDKSTTSGDSIQFISPKVENSIISLSHYYAENCYEIQQYKNRIDYTCHIIQFQNMINFEIRSTYILIIIR